MTTSTSQLTRFQILEEEAKCFSDFLKNNEKSKRNPETQDKINKVTKWFRNLIFEKEKLLVQEIVNSVTKVETADQILKDWTSLLKKCGYNDSPLVKLQKKIDYILKAGNTLDRDFQQFQRALDRVIKDVSASRGNFEVLKKATKWLKGNCKWFYAPMKGYIDPKLVVASQEKLEKLFHIVIRLPQTSDKNLQNNICHMLYRAKYKLPAFPHYQAFELLHKPLEEKMFREFIHKENDRDSLSRGNCELRFEEVQDLFSAYHQFSTEFKALLQDVEKSKSSIEVLKEADRWLKDNCKWFYMIPMKDYVGEDRIIQSQRKLRHLFKAVETHLNRTDTVLQRTISRILPQCVEDLPEEPLFEVFKFLPAKDQEEIDASIKVIKMEADKINSMRDVTDQDPNLYYQLLAQWISNQKVPLAALRTDLFGILAIAPYLTYMDLTGLKKTWSSQNLYRLIEFASSSLVSLKLGFRLALCGITEGFQNADDKDDPFRRLPVNLPKLEHLDCSNCSYLEEIPPYGQLKSLKSSNTSVPTLCEYSLLEELDIGGNNVITELPSLPNLGSLDHCNCKKLQVVPCYPKLRDYVYERCPKLSEILNKRHRTKTPVPLARECETKKRKKTS